MPFGKTQNQGKFFKPRTYVNAVAILVKYLDWYHDADNQYQGKSQPRDVVQATVTVFETAESLDAGEPTEILDPGLLTHVGLTNAVMRAPEELAVLVRKQRSSTPGNSDWYGFQDIEDGNVLDKLEKYVANRDEFLRTIGADEPQEDEPPF